VPELWRFIGILVFSGFVKVDNREDLFAKNPYFNFSYVESLMSERRFREILACLHWENTAGLSSAEKKARKDQDCFWNLATLMEKIDKSFQDYFNLGQVCDIDEQGIPGKCYHHAIQYNKDKPYKWFFKVFGLNDSFSGYLHRFFLYRGSKYEDRPQGSNITASSWPIWKLTENNRLHHKNHVLIADNYYSSLAVVDIVKSRGMEYIGTVRSNRQGLPKDAAFAKEGAQVKKRGTMVSYSYKEKYYITSWQDTKPVMMLSTMPTTQTKIIRNTKDNDGRHQVLELYRPNIIGLYNMGMGGTDLFDQRLKYNRFSIKSKRWPHRVIFHLFNCCMINAYILHKLKNNLQRKDMGYAQRTFIYSLMANIKERFPRTQEEIRLLPPPERFVAASQAWKSRERQFGFHYPVNQKQRDDQGTNNRRHCVVCGQRTSTYCKTCMAYCCLGHGEEFSCFWKLHKLSSPPQFK
jgi:hypothetical protein